MCGNRDGLVEKDEGFKGLFCGLDGHIYYWR